MNGKKLTGAILLAIATLNLNGCGSFSVLEGKKIDYKSAGKLPPLEIPPDLTTLASDDRYTVPDINPQGTATFSSYSKERGSQPVQSGATGLLPSIDKVRVERSGSQRWLVVKAPPEQVWNVVREFWQEMGFIVKMEVPESGVMETDWAENRAKIPQDPLRNVLSKVLDSLYSTAERDKFRTRLERNQGETEIYVSHRGMIEVYEGTATGASNGRTVWQPRPADSELEAEMLGRLMVRFGIDEARAKTLMASDGIRERAKITRTQEGAGSLSIVDPFDRAWRRVGLALDRVGFTVEDRDRSKGMYFVRYVDPEVEGAKDEKGFLSKLAFWKSSKAPNKNEQFRIQVSESTDGSVVRVLNKDNVAEKSETSDRILNLLHEQLK